MAKNKVQHILVIRLSAMGDVAMTVPVLSAFTQQYPEAKLTFLTRGFFSPMFQASPKISVFEVHLEGRHRGFSGLYRLFLDLKRLEIDAVADLHNVLRSKVLRFFFQFTGIPFVQINKGRKEKRALTRVHNKIFKPLKTTHTRYADVFTELGFPLDLSHKTILPSLKPTMGIKKLLGNKTETWLGVAPFAAHKGKEYPLDAMQEVLQSLDNTKKYKIMLFGGGNEEVEKLNAMADGIETCINLAGVLSFSDQLIVISQLDAMLSMDSGNGHLAAMFGVPVITLWGITHPYAGFAPFGQEEEHSLLADRKQFPAIPTSVYGNKCPKGYGKAIRTIRPQDVFQRIERLS